MRLEDAQKDALENLIRIRDGLDAKLQAEYDSYISTGKAADGTLLDYERTEAVARMRQNKMRYLRAAGEVAAAEKALAAAEAEAQGVLEKDALLTRKLNEAQAKLTEAEKALAAAEEEVRAAQEAEEDARKRLAEAEAAANENKTTKKDVQAAQEELKRARAANVKAQKEASAAEEAVAHAEVQVDADKAAAQDAQDAIDSARKELDAVQKNADDVLKEAAEAQMRLTEAQAAHENGTADKSAVTRAKRAATAAKKRGTKALDALDSARGKVESAQTRADTARITAKNSAKAFSEKKRALSEAKKEAQAAAKAEADAEARLKETESAEQVSRVRRKEATARKRDVVAAEKRSAEADRAQASAERSVKTRTTKRNTAKDARDKLRKDSVKKLDEVDILRAVLEAKTRRMNLVEAVANKWGEKVARLGMTAVDVLPMSGKRLSNETRGKLALWLFATREEAKKLGKDTIAQFADDLIASWNLRLGKKEAPKSGGGEKSEAEKREALKKLGVQVRQRLSAGKPLTYSEFDEMAEALGIPDSVFEERENVAAFLLDAAGLTEARELLKANPSLRAHFFAEAPLIAALAVNDAAFAEGVTRAARTIAESGGVCTADTWKSAEGTEAQVFLLMLGFGELGEIQVPSERDAGAATVGGKPMADAGVFGVYLHARLFIYEKARAARGAAKSGEPIEAFVRPFLDERGGETAAFTAMALAIAGARAKSGWLLTKEGLDDKDLAKIIVQATEALFREAARTPADKVFAGVEEGLTDEEKATVQEMLDARAATAKEADAESDEIRRKLEDALVQLVYVRRLKKRAAVDEDYREELLLGKISALQYDFYVRKCALEKVEPKYKTKEELQDAFRAAKKPPVQGKEEKKLEERELSFEEHKEDTATREGAFKIFALAEVLKLCATREERVAAEQILNDTWMPSVFGGLVLGKKGKELARAKSLAAAAGAACVALGGYEDEVNDALAEIGVDGNAAEQSAKRLASGLSPKGGSLNDEEKAKARAARAAYEEKKAKLEDAWHEALMSDIPFRGAWNLIDSERGSKEVADAEVYREAGYRGVTEAERTERRRSKRNVTAKEIREKFNIKVETGEDALLTIDVYAGVRGYGESAERDKVELQMTLNQVWDELADVSAFTGLPPKALGLGGKLTILVTRWKNGGTTRAYEFSRRTRGMRLPDVFVSVNTEERVLAIAHEWFHALDSYLLLRHTSVSSSTASSVFGNKNEHGVERTLEGRENYLDDPKSQPDDRSDVMRKELRAATARLRADLAAQPFAKRSISDAARAQVRAYNSGHGVEYYGSGWEVAARAFESFARVLNDDASVPESEHFFRATEDERYLLLPIFTRFFSTILVEETNSRTELYEKPLDEAVKESGTTLSEADNKLLTETFAPILPEGFRIEIVPVGGMKTKGAFVPSKKLVRIRADADSTTLAHEIYHAMRAWAEENEPELVRVLDEAARSAPQSLKEAVRRAYPEADESTYVNELGAALFSRLIQGKVLDEIEKIKDKSLKGRAKKAFEALMAMLARLYARMTGRYAERYTEDGRRRFSLNDIRGLPADKALESLMDAFLKRKAWTALAESNTKALPKAERARVAEAQKEHARAWDELMADERDEEDTEPAFMTAVPFFRTPLTARSADELNRLADKLARERKIYYWTEQQKFFRAMREHAAREVARRRRLAPKIAELSRAITTPFEEPNKAVGDALGTLAAMGYSTEATLDLMQNWRAFGMSKEPTFAGVSLVLRKAVAEANGWRTTLPDALGTLSDVYSQNAYNATFSEAERQDHKDNAIIAEYLSAALNAQLANDAEREGAGGALEQRALSGGEKGKKISERMQVYLAAHPRLLSQLSGMKLTKAQESQICAMLRTEADAIFATDEMKDAVATGDSAALSRSAMLIEGEGGVRRGEFVHKPTLFRGVWIREFANRIERDGWGKAVSGLVQKNGGLATFSWGGKNKAQWDEVFNSELAPKTVPEQVFAILSRVAGESIANELGIAETGDVRRRIPEKSKYAGADDIFFAAGIVSEYRKTALGAKLSPRSFFAGKRAYEGVTQKEALERYNSRRHVTKNEILDKFGILVEDSPADWRGRDGETVYDVFYDNFMFLSAATGLPPKALGLDGTLQLRAVFPHNPILAGGDGVFIPRLIDEERGTAVVSTRVMSTGDTGVMHEWFHALDNYWTFGREPVFGLTNEDESSSSFSTDVRLYHGGAESATRAETVRAWRELVAGVRSLGFFARSEKVDKMQGSRDGQSRYWSQTAEALARAFQVYVETALYGQSVSDTQPSVGRFGGDVYPRVKQGDTAAAMAIVQLFDRFFATLRVNADSSLEERELDFGGNAEPDLQESGGLEGKELKEILNSFKLNDIPVSWGTYGGATAEEAARFAEDAERVADGEDVDSVRWKLSAAQREERERIREAVRAATREKEVPNVARRKTDSKPKAVPEDEFVTEAAVKTFLERARAMAENSQGGVGDAEFKAIETILKAENGERITRKVLDDVSKQVRKIKAKAARRERSAKTDFERQAAEAAMKSAENLAGLVKALKSTSAVEFKGSDFIPAGTPVNKVDRLMEAFGIKPFHTAPNDGAGWCIGVFNTISEKYDAMIANAADEAEKAELTASRDTEVANATIAIVSRQLKIAAFATMDTKNNVRLAEMLVRLKDAKDAEALKEKLAAVEAFAVSKRDKSEKQREITNLREQIRALLRPYAKEVNLRAEQTNRVIDGMGQYFLHCAYEAMHMTRLGAAVKEVERARRAARAAKGREEAMMAVLRMRAFSLFEKPLKKMDAAEMLALIDELKRISEEGSRLREASVAEREAKAKAVWGEISDAVGDGGGGAPKKKAIKSFLQFSFSLRQRLESLCLAAKDEKKAAAAKAAIMRLCVALSAANNEQCKIYDELRYGFQRAAAEVLGGKKLTAGRSDFKRNLEKFGVSPLLFALSEKAEGSERFSKNGERLTWGQLMYQYLAMSQKEFRDAFGRMTEEEIAEMEARDENDLVKQAWERWKKLEELEAFLGSDRVRFARRVARLFVKIAPRIDACSSRQTGMPISNKDSLYFPLVHDLTTYMQNVESKGNVSVIPPFLTEREPSIEDIDETADIISVFSRHAFDAAHYIAYSENGISDALADVLSEDAWRGFRTAIARIAGLDGQLALEEHLKVIINGKMVGMNIFGDFEEGNKAFRWIRYVTMLTSLGLNPISGMKQATSVFAYANIIGWRGIFKALASLKDKESREAWSELWGEIYHSSWYRSRYGDAMFDAAIRAQNNVLQGKVKGNTLRALYAFERAAMSLTGNADKVPMMTLGVAVYAAIRAKYLSEGLPKKEAIRRALDEFGYTVDQCQQARDLQNMDSISRGNSALWKLFIQFKTSPLQYIAAWVAAAEKFASKPNFETFSGVLGVTIYNHIVNPLMLGGVGALWTLIVGFLHGDDDKDEKDESAVLKALDENVSLVPMITGAFDSLPLVGGVAGFAALFADEEQRNYIRWKNPTTPPAIERMNRFARDSGNFLLSLGDEDKDSAHELHKVVREISAVKYAESLVFGEEWFKEKEKK